MGVMTAAAMTKLAKGKATVSNSRDATTKFSLQQHQQQLPPPLPRHPSTPPAAKTEPADAPKLEPPTPGTYTDFQLWSRADDSFLYSTMRLKPPNSSRIVELSDLTQPMKLNRKNPKSKNSLDPNGSMGSKDIKWKPLKGLDGREVIGKDGKVVMAATIDGKEVLQANYGKEKPAKAEPEGKKKSTPFKKKTKQVFTAPDEVRQLRRDERFPWLLEPHGDPDTWTGKMTDQNEDGIYGLFVANPTGGGGFSFIPVHRCYDFVKTSTHAASMTSEEAEAKYANALKKNSLIVQFAARGGGTPSAATLATINASESKPKVAVKKEEDSGDGLFGDGDVKKEDNGAEGAYDEMEFELEHADDEENMEDEEMEDEEAKQSKARIKREQVAANKTVDSRVDESDDESEQRLTGEGRKMKRALGKMDQAYDSDDDDRKNPYASSEEEEEEEILPVPIPTTQESNSNQSTPRTTPKPRSNQPTNKVLKTASGNNSRGNSPGVSGAALVAMRATSPHKASKRSSGGTGAPSGVRAGSPLATISSRAGSPALENGHVGSPLASAPPQLVQSSEKPGKAKGPLPPASHPSLQTQQRPQPPAPTIGKRKMDDTSASIRASTPVKKKKKVEPIEPFEGMLPESFVIDFFRQHPHGVKSSAIIAHCKKWLELAPQNKTVLTEIVKRIGDSHKKDDGGYLLTLKAGY